MALITFIYLIPVHQKGSDSKTTRDYDVLWICGNVVIRTKDKSLIVVWTFLLSQIKLTKTYSLIAMLFIILG